jgi:hypothetical protein
MLRRIKTRIVVGISAILLPVGTLLVLGGGHALAATGYDGQICGSNGTTNACVNAWGGGPAVDVFNVMGSEPNDEFYIGTLSNGNSYIEYMGGGTYNHLCIGDLNNSSTDAATGLDTCPTTTNGGGWGTNFTIQTGGQGEGTAFKNNHWGGYLAPGSYTKEEPFYLNHSGSFSFGVYQWNATS